MRKHIFKACNIVLPPGTKLTFFHKLSFFIPCFPVVNRQITMNEFDQRKDKLNDIADFIAKNKFSHDDHQFRRYHEYSTRLDNAIAEYKCNPDQFITPVNEFFIYFRQRYHYSFRNVWRFIGVSPLS